MAEQSRFHDKTSGSRPNASISTPLYLAARNGTLEFVEFFLERNVNPNIVTEYGYTALHAAAQSGNQTVVKKLLDASCDGLHPSKRGQTPSSFALLLRKVEVVNL